MALTNLTDIPVMLPSDDVIDFSKDRLGTGLQQSEISLPDECTLLLSLTWTCLTNSLASGSAAAPQFNEGAMSTLQGMGFSELRSQKALLATGNSDAEAAMEWLFVHIEDAG